MEIRIEQRNHDAVNISAQHGDVTIIAHDGIGLSSKRDTRAFIHAIEAAAEEAFGLGN